MDSFQTGLRNAHFRFNIGATSIKGTSVIAQSQMSSKDMGRNCAESTDAPASCLYIANHNTIVKLEVRPFLLFSIYIHIHTSYIE